MTCSCSVDEVLGAHRRRCLPRCDRADLSTIRPWFVLGDQRTAEGVSPLYRYIRTVAMHGEPRIFDGE